MFASRADVLVMGSGPAGLGVAVACARLGLDVVCVAPAPFAPWARSFAVWSCEAAGIGEPELIEAAWRAPAVWLDDRTRLDLPHAYARVDVARWQNALVTSCRTAGVTFATGSVAALDHDALGTTASLASGEVHRASVVVDATGPASPFVERVPAKRRPAFQTAYGELCELDRPLEMALMDYRGEEDGAPPSFLYALPLPDGRVFVEETVLASRPAVPMTLLATRLERRLERMGVRRARVFEREHCLIPLGIPLPRLDQRVIPFGAAASAVNPATGYQVARTAALAPDVARAIASAPDPTSAARRAHHTIWPLSRRVAWDLYAFGMEAICGFDLHGIRAFLKAFFALPDASWLAFLRGTSSPLAIAVAMARVLAAADPAVRDAILRLLLRQTRPLTRQPMLEESA